MFVVNSKVYSRLFHETLHASSVFLINTHEKYWNFQLDTFFRFIQKLFFVYSQTLKQASLS